MAENSKIEWTDATWNPWYGCLKISPGCKLCYMYRDMLRYGRDPRVVVRSKTKFDDPLKWVRSGKPPKLCFTCSWSDFFIEQADQWRAEAWEIIRKTPEITYQILTKRPERIFEHLPHDWINGYQNVWLGTSVENGDYIERIEQLKRIPAKVRYLSLEPLLGPLPKLDLSGIHWVIVGGESGPNARPMHPDWACSLRDQCQAAGVPFFFKQQGEWAWGSDCRKEELCLYHDGRSCAFTQEAITAEEKRSGIAHKDSGGTVVSRLGKKAAGRLLDGREWNEYPESL